MPNYKPIPELTPETIARFWSKVDRGNDDACWPWIAYCDKYGYGMFSIKHRDYKAHRVALAIVGKFSDTLQVRHSCNNPPCVNPRHLLFGTAAQDGMDRRVAGKLKGSRHGRSKLIETDIPIIRNLAKTMIQMDIGILFKVAQGRISDIITNKTWTHVVGVATDEEVRGYFVGCRGPGRDAPSGPR